MTFLLYDYIDAQGVNHFADWARTLQKKELAKLNQKLDMLHTTGDALFPHVLTGTPVAGIQKIRVKGSVQLRPLLCKGPVGNEDAFTLLAGATEVGSKLLPTGIATIAETRKREVIADPVNRRGKHVRIAK